MMTSTRTKVAVAYKVYASPDYWVSQRSIQRSIIDRLLMNLVYDLIYYDKNLAKLEEYFVDDEIVLLMDMLCS